jgi:hypothetical protein
LVCAPRRRPLLLLGLALGRRARPTLALEPATHGIGVALDLAGDVLDRKALAMQARCFRLPLAVGFGSTGRGAVEFVAAGRATRELEPDAALGALPKPAVALHGAGELQPECPDETGRHDVQAETLAPGIQEEARRGSSLQLLVDRALDVTPSRP